MAKQRFTKEDIGGEVLSILTTGLYSDPFDALREYIQNAIDAGTKAVTIEIDPSTIQVSDSGTGMNREVARRAIRLGISDKKATENIGFRGIGIYSAFNICDRLEIFTRAARDRIGSKITFNFKQMRAELAAEAERRISGKPPSLYLEALLERTVWVDDDNESESRRRGTRVLMTELLATTHRRLMDWDSVVNYLQDVVPLPFDAEFSHSKLLEAKFKEHGHKLVPLTLQIGPRRAAIFRPYTDALFTAVGRYEPKFFKLDRFGFAWACANGRRVLKDTRLRGLLLKKQGFSIDTRAFLEAFFKRTVLSRRITGEIIIEHPALLPNAARNDFEPNSTRQEFLEHLPKFIAQIAKWADSIQQSEKALEVLAEVADGLHEISADLPKSLRDSNVLLKLNTELSNLERQLQPHQRELLNSAKSDYAQLTKDIARCKTTIQDALSGAAKRQKTLERNIAHTVQAEKSSARIAATRPRPQFSDLGSVLDNAGLRVSKDLQRAMRTLDDVLSSNLDDSAYAEFLTQFAEALDES